MNASFVSLRMNQRIAQLALVVREYDEAINFYQNCFGFELIEDTPLNDTKRWVVMRPKGEGSCNLLLARAVNERQLAAVGNQAGGRVFLFLHTDDVLRDVVSLQEKGVKIVRPVSKEAYGSVAVVEDLYGNLWDLIQPSIETEHQ